MEFKQESMEQGSSEYKSSEAEKEEYESPGQRVSSPDMPDDAIKVIREMDEEKRNRRYIFIYGVLTGCLIFIVLYALADFLAPRFSKLSGKDRSDEVQAVSEELLSEDVENKINDIAAMLSTYYYEDVDTEEIRTGIYRGIMNSVGDKYTTYYTAEEYVSMMTNTSATYYGIGALLSQDATTSVVTVIHVYEDSPAYDAGITAGDKIVSVNGTDATTVALSELVKLIKGEEGTTVSLRVYRPDTGEYKDYELERRNVDIPTVAGEILEDSGNIGYIQIAEFGTNTAREFIKEYEDLKSRGMEKLIIDVRDNPGGMFASAVSLCDFILPEGLVVYTEDKYHNRDEYRSEASCIDMPMAVLINGNSASSAEIFAGAVRDYGYATLIGKKTYGKGIVQTVKRLSDGSAVKMTTSRYFTPKGENIHGVGISPDIELDYEYSGPQDGDFDYRYDNQIMRAVEVLSE